MLRIALIGSSRHPIAEPFAGGLEAHVWHLADRLRARGHRVTLFAADGSDPDLGVEVIVPAEVALSEAARRDVSMPPVRFLAEHHAYLSLMVALAGERGEEFDVVHNHALHYLPVAMAGTLGRPLLTTLHTPPTPWLETAVQTSTAGTAQRYVAVSAHTAASWEPATGAVPVIANGIDPARWPVGPGGGNLLWFGRLVPEKGADLAIAAAARAGRSLRLAGPVGDERWFRREVEPLLSDRVRHLGHLDQRSLAAEVGRSSAVLVTPRWDEPYGLVVAEALACGTPVAGFARGGIPEIVSPACAVLVAPDDVEALAAAIPRAEQLDRSAARARAVAHCSIDAMVDAYEEIYAELAA